MSTELDTEAQELARSIMRPPPPADPWAIYRRLVEIAPVVRVDDLVIATGYKAVSHVLRSSNFGQGPPEWHRMRHLPRFGGSKYLQTVANGMVMADPPEHTRLRRMLTKAFTPRAIAAMEPFVQQTVDKLLSAAESKPVVDLKTDFAGRLPISVIGHLVGFPEEDHERLAHWGHVTEYASSPFVPDDQLAAADEAVFELEEYTNGLYADRLANPRDDILTELVQAADEDAMTREEFATHVLALVVAGTQTTAHMITSAVVGFAERPEQLERFRNDRTVDERAIEEFLRFFPPLHTAFPRLALEDTEIGGMPIAQKQPVLPVIAAANRDPSVFELPDQLLIDRDPSSPLQLSFASGPHLCIGRGLARLEGRIAIRTLVDRYPDLTVDLDHVVPWATAMARGHERVPARLNV